MNNYLDYLTLCAAAAAGGAINSIAGGGTLLTFPALFAALGASDDASVIANATSTVALFPGSLASMAGYRRELAEAPRWSLWLILPCLLGGYCGSRLVIWLPSATFKTLVPWLILVAALLFWLQPQIGKRLGIGREHAPATRRSIAGTMVFQLLVAVYGGYFGAGIGILMLSALAMMGLGDIHRMNALKTLLGSCINGVAVVVFVAGGKVNWRYALVMAAAAIVGGYFGAHFARRLDRNLVRRTVVSIGFVLAAYYFYGQLKPLLSPSEQPPATASASQPPGAASLI
ncbi:MAG TPA: sulfite exporter TauE/SafE family protein [Pirellulales bacterium]|nr:sulfite exporter TauE/SafE family protein [Pirellulales bacterium]